MRCGVLTHSINARRRRDQVLGIILVPAGIGGQKMSDYKDRKRAVQGASPGGSQASFALLSRGAGMLSGGMASGAAPTTHHNNAGRDDDLMRRLDELITLLKRREEAAGNYVG
jgi:hypothetical protein